MLDPAQAPNRLDRDLTGSGERFLVTGCNGCIGSWVVRNLLLLAGAEVVATDLVVPSERVGRLLGDAEAGSLGYAAGDITEPGFVEGLCRDHGVTRVIHLAALQVPFVARDPVNGGLVNVVGTLRVLEAARQAAATVRGVAYASSSAVFGNGSGADAEPQTLYGALKRCNEESARFYGRDYATFAIGLRPCVVYGPNRDQGLTAAITEAIKAAVLEKPFVIPFSGGLDLQYAEDVAWTFIAAVLASAGEALVFDLHGELVEVARVIELIEEAAPAARGLLSAREDALPGRVDWDDAPLRAYLPGLPKTALRDGIAASLEVFRGQHAEGRLALTASSTLG
jgi:UDP-glucuronate 4-epimerase